MTVPRLFMVRGKPADSRGFPSLPERLELRSRGLFASRAEAEACRAAAERHEAGSNDFWPLYYVHSLRGLLELSEFEPPVFLDWLADHDIPHPDTVQVEEEEDRWLTWLEGLGAAKLARLYEALHRFSFTEVVEVPLVEGEYRPEDWDDWELHIPNPPPPRRAPPWDGAGGPGSDDIPF